MATCATLREQYLEVLALRLRQTSKSAPRIGTKDFVECCDTILPFFDHLGPVFHVARGEFQQKLDTLKLQAEQKPYLYDIVEADKRAKKATVKNSCTRNLHRLTAAILFMKILFERLLGSAAAADSMDSAIAADVTLRDAASAAYEAALAPFHTGIVKGVVRAGLLTLPSKEHFINSIGESEETAAVRAREVIAACQAVHASVIRLFDGIEMPASNVWLWPRS
eukprot:GHUV01001208.1.p1 GENE.GHUV01001208.1~~GHUV01001208.1.p1  ORF type:complete len:223 (+),score=32.11 GHUV01001208.1:201-869(+)